MSFGVECSKIFISLQLFDRIHYLPLLISRFYYCYPFGVYNLDVLMYTNNKYRNVNSQHLENLWQTNSNCRSSSKDLGALEVCYFADCMQNSKSFSFVSYPWSRSYTLWQATNCLGIPSTGLQSTSKYSGGHLWFFPLTFSSTVWSVYFLPLFFYLTTK